MEITLRKFDENRDGQISLEDYKKTVQQNPLMIEVLYPCLIYSPLGLDFSRAILDHIPATRIYQE